MTGHLIMKSGVYSYGVVLQEFLTKRKLIDMSQTTKKENLVTWYRSLLTSKVGLEALGNHALGKNPPFNNRLETIASVCVQREVSHQPFMG